MKIIYCIDSTFHSGGMERVLVNKANYLAEKMGFEIIIITTEQQNNKSFFKLFHTIRCIDLAINYTEDTYKPILIKSYLFFQKRKKHKQKLSELLLQIKPNIVISMFGNEASFLYKIKDGSKKVLEYHFSKDFRLSWNRTGLKKLIDMYKNKQDERIAKKYDRFIVLTNEDKHLWGDYKNIKTIPNAAINSNTSLKASLEAKNIIAIGRLSYQKGYDRLIEAWQLVHAKNSDWQLQIYGSGELLDELQNTINSNNLQNTIKINKPTSHIEEVYLNSSALVLSSRYEGLPMVLLEAMSYGLPVISFACKCGPTDVIDNNIDGFLIEDGNIQELANAMTNIIENDKLRKQMGMNASQKASLYSEEKVMHTWLALFEQLTEHNGTKD